MTATASKTGWPPALRLTRNVILGAALTLMIIHFIVYVLYTASLLRFPFDYDEGEGYEIQNSVYLSQGTLPYFNNDVIPFYGTNYPPFFHLVMVPLVAVFGPQYWYGRLVVSLMTVLCAAAIGYAVYRDTRYRWVALLAGLAFLASNFIYHIGPLYRQHMVMVALETFAIVAIANLFELPRDRQRRRIIVVIVLLIMAGFTKQMALVSWLAVFGFLFLRGARRAIVWGIVALIPVAVLFVLLVAGSQGYFWLNVITANVYEYLLFQFTGLLQMFLRLHWGIVVLAAFLFIYELYFDRLSVYSIWLVTSGINVAFSGKWGAGDSYFAEMIAAVCILAGIFTARSLNRQWRLPPHLMQPVERGLAALRLSLLIPRLARRMTQGVGIGALALFVVYGLSVIKLPLDVPGFREVAQALNITSNTKFPQFYDSAGWTFGYATIGQMPSQQDIINGWRIVDLVDDDARPILSDEAAFNFHTHTPVLTNPPHIKGLWLGGHYDPTELVRRIEQQEFGAVIVRLADAPRGEQDIVAFWPDPIVEAVRKAYNIREIVPMNGFQYAVMQPDATWKPG